MAKFAMAFFGLPDAQQAKAEEFFKSQGYPNRIPPVQDVRARFSAPRLTNPQ
jgi:hypothetical protein